MYTRRAFSPSTVLWAFHTIQPSSIFFIRVARDRDSDSERLLYFGRVIFYYSRPRIASAIAEDLYFGRVIFTVASDSGRLLYFGRVIFFIFFIFFRPPNFRRPWADFHETLPHDAVYAEIVYLL